jgi:hypothetical protein
MMLSAMTPRTVLLIGALSLTAGWWLGTSTSSLRNQADAPAVRSSGPRPLGSPANVAPLTQQLRERLNPRPPRAPAVGRNPFTFGARRLPSVARDREERAAEAPPPAPIFVEPAAPQFKLSGIASSIEDGATVWTAIINDHGALAFVKTGEALSNGFRVVRVEETGVVIVDVTGVTQTLRLP